MCKDSSEGGLTYSLCAEGCSEGSLTVGTMDRPRDGLKGRHDSSESGSVDNLERGVKEGTVGGPEDGIARGSKGGV